MHEVTLFEGVRGRGPAWQGLNESLTGPIWLPQIKVGVKISVRFDCSYF